MQMQILKIAVVLLIAGSSDARPQASGRFLKRRIASDDVSREVASRRK
jgi:hypothetical protein